MPIGYLVSTGLTATSVLAAVVRHCPRRSSPFRLSYFFGFLFNWPVLAFLLLVASTMLAVAQSGVGSLVFWLGFGFAILASAGLLVLRQRQPGTGPTVERALDEGLGSGWRDDVDAELAARLRRRPSFASLFFTPIAFRRQGVERIANIRYGPAGRKKQHPLRPGGQEEPARPLSRSLQSFESPNAHLFPLGGLPLRKQEFRNPQLALSASQPGLVECQRELPVDLS